MASPHVASVAALFLQNGSVSPDEILAASMLAKAVEDIVIDVKGSPNEFLQRTAAPGGAPATTYSPTAAPQANPTDSPTAAPQTKPTDSPTAVPTSTPVDPPTRLPIFPPTTPPPLICQDIGESCLKQGCPGLLGCCCDGLKCNKGRNGHCV